MYESIQLFGIYLYCYDMNDENNHFEVLMADLNRGVQQANAPPPPNLVDYVFPPFCIRMLQNNAQIAWECI